MDKRDVQQLNEKLDIVIRLHSLGLIQGRTQREQIALLSVAGIQPKDIASLLNTTPNTVRVELAALRKAGWKIRHLRKEEERGTETEG